MCAGKEQVAVGVTERKGGIPSLVVIDAAGDVVDFHGVETVEKHGAKALTQWR